MRSITSLLVFVALAASDVTGSLPANYTVEDIISTRCDPAQPCYPSPEDIALLSDQMDGYVTLKTETKFYDENLMYNKAEQRASNMIAMVKSKEDIQKAVLFARANNLHVTVKSTGHDYAGRSAWEGSFVIHLGLMEDIQVNPNATPRSPHGELKTETGTNWKTIYQLLDGNNRTIVGGSAWTVGPGGYTLGGGHSPISRSLGYAVDNVLEMQVDPGSYTLGDGHNPISRSLGYSVDNVLEIQVVLADGSIATCTDDQTVIVYPNGTQETRNDGQLLWAQKGGGGGTFGVTVYIVFKLHPATEMVLFSGTFPLRYEFPEHDAYDMVMNALQNFLLNAPNHWGGYYFISPAAFTFSNIRMRGSVFLFFNKFGPLDDSVNEDLREFLAIRDTLKLLDVKIESKTSFWDYEQNARDPPSANTYLIASMLGREEARTKLHSFFEKELFTYWRDQPFTCTGIMVGGKTTEPAVDATPLNPGFRSAVSVLSCGVDFNYGNEDALLEKAEAFTYRLRRMGEGMYFNEPSKNSIYWREDYWGKTNYAKLVQIKERYDPENFFTCYHCVNSDNHSYPPEQEPETSGSARCRAQWLSLVSTVVLMFALMI